MKPVNTPSSDPKKLALAQKIQAMKMRQRATPGDPKDKTANLSSDQRLHLQVKLEGNDAVSVLWFRKVNIPLQVTCA
jgi:3-hydroxymyristoyl/3-hydroxydecanoyl-(acyl carrier protein) dehydratase